MVFFFLCWVSANCARRLGERKTMLSSAEPKGRNNFTAGIRRSELPPHVTGELSRLRDAVRRRAGWCVPCTVLDRRRPGSSANLVKPRGMSRGVTCTLLFGRGPHSHVWNNLLLCSVSWAAKQKLITEQERLMCDLTKQILNQLKAESRSSADNLPGGVHAQPLTFE